VLRHDPSYLLTLTLSPSVRPRTSRRPPASRRGEPILDLGGRLRLPADDHAPEDGAVFWIKKTPVAAAHARALFGTSTRVRAVWPSSARREVHRARDRAGSVRRIDEATLTFTSLLAVARG